jgi:hypothetical protein
MGRNAEYFTFGLADRGMLVVVYHPADGSAVAAVSFLGMIGAFTGVNDRGVAFGNMLVFNAADSGEQPGLPIQIALRLAAHRAATAAQLAAILQSQRHAIPMNVMVADGREALAMELGIAGTAIRRGQDGSLAQTNYFLTEGLAAYPPQCDRHDLLLAAAQANRGRMGIEEMKKALHQARINALNVQAVVFEPAAMRMHVSVNRLPASAGPYVLMDLAKLFATPPLTAGPARP